MKTRNMKRIENTQYNDPVYYDKFIGKMKNNHGITVPESTKTVKCPYCGFVFNLLFGRAIACSGCSRAATGCKLARCPKCDQDFSITGIISPMGLNKLAGTYKRYYENMGWSTRS